MCVATLRRRTLKIRVSDILVMAFFWGLLYIEPLPLGPLKLSELWKAATILVLTALLFRRQVPLWFLFALLFLGKSFIYTSSPYGFTDNLSMAMEIFFFPVLVLYLLRTMPKYVDWPDRLILVSLKISLFFIFSAVPFLMGLESLHTQRDLSMWGSDSRAVTGLFASLSPASKIFYTSTLVVAAGYSFFPQRIAYQLIYFFSLIMGSYLVYGSFTRTGWFTYAAGLIIIALLQQNRSRKLIALMTLAIAAMIASFYLLQNEAFLLRLAGGATYRTDVQIGLDALLRARIPFIFVAIDNLNGNGLPGWFLGHGVKEGTDLFKIKTGMAITSHNGTFNLLEATGLIGLAFYLVFCGLLARALFTAFRHDPDARILYAVTAYTWAATFLISHGLPFYAQFALIGPMARSLLVQRKNRQANTSIHHVKR
ncbi:hypothetical protein HLM50_17525 [Sulfitobacter sp. Ks41]|uniref:hypothetical protein n=1 Tax=Sulfitobacter sp. Ks41 TaxID=2731139 RepID=UPI0023E19C4D|nr:hypothetical protein [Sulfitobacter sp. Ks41]MDF3362851.1 hypothetical protein [Sulfitobacter sp. Ks41]